jgi:hypothetical protein
VSLEQLKFAAEKRPLNISNPEAAAVELVQSANCGRSPMK